MSDAKPMPRGVVAIAGGLIFVAALIGLYIGGAGGRGSRYSDADVADIVQTRPVANAQALVAPPVSETDVRKWAREEAQAAVAHGVPHRAEPAAGDDDATDTPDATPLTAPTLAPTTPPAKPAKPASPGAE